MSGFYVRPFSKAHQLMALKQLALFFFFLQIRSIHRKRLPFKLISCKTSLLFLVPINMKRISGEIPLKLFDEGCKLGVCSITAIQLLCPFECVIRKPHFVEFTGEMQNSSDYFEQIFSPALCPWKHKHLGCKFLWFIKWNTFRMAQSIMIQHERPQRKSKYALSSNNLYPP